MPRALSQGRRDLVVAKIPVAGIPGPYALAAFARAQLAVARLCHDPLDAAADGHVVVVALGAQGQEVLAGLCAGFAEELELQWAVRRV